MAELDNNGPPFVPKSEWRLATGLRRWALELGVRLAEHKGGDPFELADLCLDYATGVSAVDARSERSSSREVSHSTSERTAASCA